MYSLTYLFHIAAIVKFVRPVVMSNRMIHYDIPLDVEIISSKTHTPGSWWCGHSTVNKSRDIGFVTSNIIKVFILTWLSKWFNFSVIFLNILYLNRQNWEYRKLGLWMTNRPGWPDIRSGWPEVARFLTYFETLKCPCKYNKEHRILGHHYIYLYPLSGFHLEDLALTLVCILSLYWPRLTDVPLIWLSFMVYMSNASSTKATADNFCL